MPNYSHGTAGIATALAIAGAALGRGDFIAAARQGAQHLLAVGSLDDDGFIVPHTLPYSSRDVEPVTYTWCHGPAGTSHLFAALAQAGVDTVAGLGVTRLRQRCLHSILASGVPQRLRPGFWDNDGRCCGTAGVGDVLLDAAQDCTGPGAMPATLLRAARTMADALVERAIQRRAPGPGGGSSSTARTRRCCHPVPRGCKAPPGSPPSCSAWPGSSQDGPAAPVIDRPDQWWAVPARLRTVRPVS